MFRYLLKDYSSKTITLNSSPYGVPFYKAVGFVPTDEEKTVNGIRFTPMEYRIEGAKTVYGDSLCPIRQCAREKQMATCGSCPEMKTCEKVGAIIGNNPDARSRIENAGSI